MCSLNSQHQTGQPLCTAAPLIIEPLHLWLTFDAFKPRLSLCLKALFISERKKNLFQYGHDRTSKIICREMIIKILEKDNSSNSVK